MERVRTCSSARWVLLWPCFHKHPSFLTWFQNELMMSGSLCPGHLLIHKCMTVRLINLGTSFIASGIYQWRTRSDQTKLNVKTALKKCVQLLEVVIDAYHLHSPACVSVLPCHNLMGGAKAAIGEVQKCVCKLQGPCWKLISALRSVLVLYWADKWQFLKIVCNFEDSCRRGQINQINQSRVQWLGEPPSELDFVIMNPRQEQNKNRKITKMFSCIWQLKHQAVPDDFRSSVSSVVVWTELCVERSREVNWSPPVGDLVQATEQKAEQTWKRYIL